MMSTHRQIIRRRPGGQPFQEDSPASVHPLLRRVLENRGVGSLKDLDHSLARLHPPELLKDADLAADLLAQALARKQKIIIAGDYDTDGATASVVGILGLQAMGARNVGYMVPNRFEYGYGLSPGFAEVLISARPDLVVTVDNGISSVEGVGLLRKAGIKVIVTDHHLAGKQLPDASAIVNPNQPGCRFPSRALAGVGVMFYVLLALRAKLRQDNWFGQSALAVPNLAELLDLVALGTVADLVPLDHNNRILVARGIARIQRQRCRPGLLAILRVAGKSAANIVSGDLGFVVGPRLNAAGRLDDISIGIECLLANDLSAAMELAGALNDINTERKKIEQQMQSQALESFNTDDLSDERNGLCLFNEDWHQGITGLVASRVKDRMQKPVVVFAPNADGSLSGSVRSVSGLHIRDLLEAISSASPGMIDKFGGHAMAAGLTIERQNLQQFGDHFDRFVSAHFAVNPPVNQLLTDGPLDELQMNQQVAELLRNAAPWGQQFPAPLFDNHFKVLSQRVLGGQHLKMQLALGKKTVDAIAFRYLQPDRRVPDLEQIHAVFQLDINEFGGNRNLQLIIEHLIPV